MASNMVALGMQNDSEGCSFNFCFKYQFESVGQTKLVVFFLRKGFISFLS